MVTPLDRHSLMSSFAIVGDSKVHEAYSQLIYKNWGGENWEFRIKFDKYLPRGEYGFDLDLILLEFYVEGSHAWFPIPDEIKIGRYTKKDKSISIKIPMLKPISEAILNDNNVVVREFLINTFTKVGELVLASKPISKLDFNKEKFKTDYRMLMQHLLDDAPK
jgi:hypothetical protein